MLSGTLQELVQVGCNAMQALRSGIGSGIVWTLVDLLHSLS